MKTCSYCRAEKPLSEFGLRPANRDGHEGTCRTCRSTRTQDVHAGLKPGQFMQTLLAQEGKCKICKSELTSPQRDHCHKTGVFRGLLCVKCNTGLGKFNDDPALMRIALAHLEEFPG